VLVKKQISCLPINDYDDRMNACVTDPIFLSHVKNKPEDLSGHMWLFLRSALLHTVLQIPANVYDGKILLKTPYEDESRRFLFLYDVY
jgi:hypothetical protein